MIAATAADFDTMMMMMMMMMTMVMISTTTRRRRRRWRRRRGRRIARTPVVDYTIRHTTIHSVAIHTAVVKLTLLLSNEPKKAAPVPLSL